MDPSVKDIENALSEMAPRGLSDQGRQECHSVIDRLASEVMEESVAPKKSWRYSAVAAASISLLLGTGAGWYFGGPGQSFWNGEKAKADSSFVEQIPIRYSLERMEDGLVEYQLETGEVVEQKGRIEHFDFQFGTKGESRRVMRFTSGDGETEPRVDF